MKIDILKKSDIWIINLVFNMVSCVSTDCARIHKKKILLGNAYPSLTHRPQLPQQKHTY